jgi:hypothetical protein
VGESEHKWYSRRTLAFINLENWIQTNTWPKFWGLTTKPFLHFVFVEIFLFLADNQAKLCAMWETILRAVLITISQIARNYHQQRVSVVKRRNSVFSPVQDGAASNRATNTQIHSAVWEQAEQTEGTYFKQLIHQGLFWEAFVEQTNFCKLFYLPQFLSHSYYLCHSEVIFCL